MITFLIVSGLAAAWVLSLLVHPFGRCWLCRGKARSAVKGRRRPASAGLARAPAAASGSAPRTVHRIRRQVAAHWRGQR